MLCGGRGAETGQWGDRGGGEERGRQPPSGPTWAGAVRVLRSLVTLIMTVVLAITLPLAGAQTTPVGAAELVGTAGWVLCGGGDGEGGPSAQSGRASPPGTGLTTLGGFIRAIGTVAVMVTHKMLGNAQAVLAHELTVITGAVVHWGQVEFSLQACPTSSW